MKRLALSLFIIATCFTTYSQDIEKEYFDKKGDKTDEASAYYYVEGTRLCDVKGYKTYDGTVKSYYVKGNVLRSVVKYEDGQKTGDYKEYHENGNLKYTSRYKEFYETGEARSYYRNGKLQRVIEYPGKSGETSKYDELDFKILECRDSLGNITVKDGEGFYKYSSEDDGGVFRVEGTVQKGLRHSLWKGYRNDTLRYEETFNHGELIEGKSFKKGETFPYRVLEERAEFPGGLSEMYKFLNNNIKYPASARRLGINGRVFVQFVIDQNGLLSDIKVIKGLHESLDNESLRLVKLMPSWSPGIYRGLKVKSKFVLPLTFKLTN